MRYPILLFIMVLFVSLASVEAQSNPVEEQLFAPELVMQNQQAIGLREDQEAFIKSEIQKVQQIFTEMQFRVQKDAETLRNLLKHDSIDEQQAVAQVQKILNSEREIKELTVRLLVRIRNKLTPEQRDRLYQIRSKG